MPKWQMERVMKQEFGSDWRNLFETFDDNPIAAASIGQVHQATIKSNVTSSSSSNSSNVVKVAVKIQYPGVAESINSDLDSLKSLLLLGDLIPKGLFLENVISVAKRELSWEVDYEREAKCTAKFRELLQIDSIFVVPQVFNHLSTKKVITTEWMDGIPIK